MKSLVGGASQTPRLRVFEPKIQKCDLSDSASRRKDYQVNRVFCVILAGLLLAAAGGPASAQDVASFYRGRPLNLVVGFNVAGGADSYARLIARHLGRHIPGNPAVVVRNMPGAGSMVAANHIFNASPKDGSEIGLFAGSIVLEPVIGGAPSRYDARQFTWIGNPAAEHGACIASHASGFKRFEDVFEHEMVTGLAPGAMSYLMPVGLSGILDTKMKLVKGYNGTSALKLAFERGEIDSFCVGYDSFLNIGFTRDKVTYLVQIGPDRHHDLQDVPLAVDYVKAPEGRQLMALLFGWLPLSRPIAAPPGIPADRASALQAGFDAAIKDPALLADAATQSLSIQPMTGPQITRFVEEIYRTPKAVSAKAALLMGRKVN